MVETIRYVGLEVPSFHNNGLLDEPRAPPSAVEPTCGGGRTLLQCLFVTQARWHQLTKGSTTCVRMPWWVVVSHGG